MDLKTRHEEIKALAKQQLGRLERMGAPTAVLAARLADDERIERLFGGQVDGKTALVAVTDQRLLVVSGGLLTKTRSIAYDQVHQLDSGFMTVKVSGSGVEVEIKSMARAADLANELHVRRSTSAAPAVADTAREADPMEQIARLAELRDAGALTDDEFASKKAELLRRI